MTQLCRRKGSDHRSSVRTFISYCILNKQLIQNYNKLPRIDNLPKTLKYGILLRLIISKKDSTNNQLGIFLEEIITPLTSKSSSHVNNSAHSGKICKAPIYFKLMVNQDVVSMFTRLPTDEILTVVRDKLVIDPSLKNTHISIDKLMEMLNVYAEMTYFGMGSDILARGRTGYGIAVVASIG